MYTNGTSTILQPNCVMDRWVLSLWGIVEQLKHFIDAFDHGFNLSDYASRRNAEIQHMIPTVCKSEGEASLISVCSPIVSDDMADVPS